jgi:hypothetical protein
MIATSLATGVWLACELKMPNPTLPPGENNFCVARLAATARNPDDALQGAEPHGKKIFRRRDTPPGRTVWLSLSSGL